MSRPRKLPLRTIIVQIVAIAVAVFVGGLILTRRVSAQPQPPFAGSGGAAAVIVADAGAPAGSTASKQDDAGPTSPLDDTVVQTEDDIPKGLSDEQKAAMGTGKVPIHREGLYHSPFANPKFGGPAHAKVGLVLNEVREFNIQTGGYDVEFFLSLTGDKDLPPLNLQFTNGHDVQCQSTADTPTFRFYRCQGSFTTPVDLRKYPFDTQHLKVQFEDQVYGADTVLFEPDPNRTSLDEGFLIAGYGVASVGAHSYKHLYPPRFDRDDLYVSRYEFVVGIDRFGISAAFSVFVPAFIIVIISLIGLWCPFEQMEVRSNAGAPMLVAAVLFHYSLIQALPATGYLTPADKLMVGVYLALLLNMISTWSLLIVAEDTQDACFKFWRNYLPPFTAVVMAASVVV